MCEGRGNYAFFFCFMSRWHLCSYAFMFATLIWCTLCKRKLRIYRRLMLISISPLLGFFLFAVYKLYWRVEKWNEHCWICLVSSHVVWQMKIYILTHINMSSNVFLITLLITYLLHIWRLRTVQPSTWKFTKSLSIRIERNFLLPAIIIMPIRLPFKRMFPHHVYLIALPSSYYY